MSSAAEGTSEQGAIWRSRVLDALREHAMLASGIAACLGLAFLFYTSGGQDDTYITYWPARTLAEHGQILSYNGARLEQSSSLSFVVALAFLYKLTPFSMPMVGFLASMGFAALTMVVSVRVARLMGIQNPVPVALLTGTVVSFSYWATSGMENTMVAAMALWVVVEASQLEGPADWRRWLRLFSAMLLFAGSRPEAPVVLVCMMTVLLVGWGISRLRGTSWMRARIVAGVIGTAAVAIGALLLFRRLYFHAWVPNPASLKAGGFNSEDGFKYLWEAFALNGFWLLAGAIVGIVAQGVIAVRGRGNGPAGLLVAGLGASQLAFIVMSGGDWMAAGRFLSPVVPALVLLSMAAVSLVVRNGRGISAVAAVLVGANLLVLVQSAHTGLGEGRPAWALRSFGELFRSRFGDHDFSPIEFANKQHHRDAVTAQQLWPIVERAHSLKRRPIWLSTGQAGMIAYHLMTRAYGKAKLIDLYALTNHELIECIGRDKAPLCIQGLAMAVPTYLEAMDRYEKECGLPTPDIFFNECLPDSDRKLLQSKGYVLVFNQTGTVKNSRSQKWFAGNMVVCGYIAVKKALADELGLKPAQDLKWDMNPE